MGGKIVPFRLKKQETFSVKMGLSARTISRIREIQKYLNVGNEATAVVRAVTLVLLILKELKNGGELTIRGRIDSDNRMRIEFQKKK